MKNNNRYTTHTDENFEPNSNDEVLSNFLHITSKNEMDIIEANELLRTELEIEELVEYNQSITALDICNFHQLWLGDIYPFAGKYRTVSMSKAGFPFAAANLIPKLMEKFEKDFLQQHTPCLESDINKLAEILGTVHAELIIIHPFREGNGRLSRLLANIMAMQAGWPQLNYSSIDQVINLNGFDDYIKAIHAAFSGNTHFIKEVFLKILNDSIN